jgi:hypothetical protein
VANHQEDVKGTRGETPHQCYVVAYVGILILYAPVISVFVCRYKARPILKISRDLNLSRNMNLEAAAPILRSENSRFFYGISSFFLLRYTREILRIAFLEISSLNVLHRLTYVPPHWSRGKIFNNFSYINNSFID